MDKDHPYTGDHSPQIALDAATPHGVAQPGLALIKGKAYAGRVVLAGTAGARVRVSLVWGPTTLTGRRLRFRRCTPTMQNFR